MWAWQMTAAHGTVISMSNRQPPTANRQPLTADR